MRDITKVSDYLRLLWHVLEGDPIAITGASLLVGMVVVICLIWWKIARDLRREDEERKQRYGSGKKKG